MLKLNMSCLVLWLNGARKNSRSVLLSGILRHLVYLLIDYVMFKTLKYKLRDYLSACYADTQWLCFPFLKLFLHCVALQKKYKNLVIFYLKAEVIMCT